MSSLFDCKYSLERNFEQHLVANTVGRFKKKRYTVSYITIKSSVFIQQVLITASCKAQIYIPIINHSTRDFFFLILGLTFWSDRDSRSTCS